MYMYACVGLFRFVVAGSFAFILIVYLILWISENINFV